MLSCFDDIARKVTLSVSQKSKEDRTDVTFCTKSSKMGSRSDSGGSFRDRLRNVYQPSGTSIEVISRPSPVAIVCARLQDGSRQMKRLTQLGPICEVGQILRAVV